MTDPLDDIAQLKSFIEEGLPVAANVHVEFDEDGRMSLHAVTDPEGDEFERTGLDADDLYDAFQELLDWLQALADEKNA